MAREQGAKMNTGIHRTRFKRNGLPDIWYVYAWRGGPRIATVEGSKPAITPALMDKAADARRELRLPTEDFSLAAQIVLFKSSPEFLNVAASTQGSYRLWLDRIETEFGKTTLRMWQSRELRGDVLDWRDKWSHQPRSADEAIKVVNLLMNWLVDRGRLTTNVLAGIKKLYDMDRSDLVWTPDRFAKFRAVASVEVNEGVDLAACTGMRRSDFLKLPWEAVKEHAIIWQTGKSKGRTTIVVPLLPEAKVLFARIKARHAACMEKLPLHQREDLPETVLTNSFWRRWSPKGFGGRFSEAKRACGLDRNLHDLRGTFVTRLCLAGLTDDEIAKIVGWDTSDVAMIREKYCSDARVVIAIGERIAKGKV